MKNLYKFFIPFAILGIFTACEDDEDAIAPTEQPALSVVANNSAFLAGETLMLTIFADDSQMTETRQDITFYFEAINTGEQTVDNSMFSTFPETAVLPANQSEITVDFPFASTLDEDSYSVRIYVSAEGTEIADATQNLTVSKYFDVTLNIVNNPSAVKEGETYAIRASVSRAMTENLTIALSYDSDLDLSYFGDLPKSITISSGNTSAVSDSITMFADDDFHDDATLTITGSTGNDSYVCGTSLSVVRQDLSTNRGDRLLSELWVYDDPSGTFYSSTAVNNNYTTSDYYNSVTDRLMVRKNAAATEASEHPHPELVGDGWFLVHADEFTPWARGWSFAVDDIQSAVADYYCPFQSPRNGWSWQNTYVEEEWCSQMIYGSSKAKYSSVLEEDGRTEGLSSGSTDGITSYMRIWSGYEECSATAGAYSGETRYIGSINLKCCTTTTVVNRWTTIGVGMRFEFRARIGGNRQGFNESVLLRLNNDEGKLYENSRYITIFSNPVSINDGVTTNIRQGVHLLDVEDSEGNAIANESYAVTTFDPTDWAIYWCEVYEDKIVFGINGTTTFTVNASDLTDWPFTHDIDSSGMNMLILQGVGATECDVPEHSGDTDEELAAARQTEPTWLDSSLKNIDFTTSITSDIVPHMEFDWIRIWANEDWAAGSASSYGNGNTFFF